MGWAADLFARMLRNSRVASALAVAVLLGGFLIWWKLWGDPGPLVAERDAPGVIAQVHPNGLVIQLDTGQQVRVVRNTKAPVGSRVVLKVRVYRSGSELYELPPLD